MPSFYHAYNLIPERDAKGVPMTTYISVTFSRPPQIVQLKMEPEVKIDHVDKEIVFLASGKFTYYPAKPLQPQMTYTVHLTFGQEEAPEGVAPTQSITWQFTTGPE
jgi:hypothetical protein